MGSNAGDSKAILTAAIQELGLTLADLETSSLYCTSPQYVLDQPDFLNLVVRGTVDHSDPGLLLGQLQAIETAYGRDRMVEQRYGPRTLDIDILLFGDLIINSPGLTIPHPRIMERAFVLVPILEVEALLVHPGTGQPFKDALPAVAGQGIYLIEHIRL